MSLIEIRDVQVAYGDLQALRGISLDVDGGAVGLLGPNGAGKSTLLRVLLGFIRPDQGAVRMFGKPMPDAALEIRQSLGYMPERDIVSPKVSAVSFLTYCGCLYGMTRADAMERAHEVLNYVGLGESRYRKMETFSTGMCQRVKFAQALVHDPKLLLLDEPTNGLDPEGRVEMLNLVRQLAYERKVAVLLSSHLLPDVEYVCERVIMIDRGQVVLDDAIAALTQTRDGLFEIRVRDHKEAFLGALTGAGFHWRDQHDGNLLVTTPGREDPQMLFEIARANDTQLRHYRRVRRSLEEAFLRAIKHRGNEDEDAESPARESVASE